MKKTISYLEEKNNYLEKFLGLNRKWLDRLTQGDFGDIEEFRETRETILNIVRHIDALIESHTMRITDPEIDDEMRSQINTLLNRKESLVKAILGQDLDIMQLIERAKSQIIADLRNVSRVRKTIGSYKSFSTKEIIDEEV